MVYINKIAVSFSSDAINNMCIYKYVIFLAKAASSKTEN